MSKLKIFQIEENIKKQLTDSKITEEDAKMKLELCASIKESLFEDLNFLQQGN